MKVTVYVFCLSALFCTSVFAGLSTIELAYQGIDAGGNQGVILDNTEIVGANGVFVMGTQNAIGNPAEALGNPVWGFCYELEQYISSSYKVYEAQSLQAAIASDKAALISQLWALHYDHSWEADTLIYTNEYISGEPAGTTENQEALAFSFAIYEIIYDYEGNMNDLDLAGGRLESRVTKTNPPLSVGVAQSWLNGLVDPGIYTGPMAHLISLSNDDKQDIIVEIPEPATMTMLVLGSLAFLRKRTL
jgi:hypothetical protein